MADTQHSEPPFEHGVPPTSTPSATSHPKRNRNKNRNHQAPSQVDGTVSDSVTYPSSTPQSKRAAKPRHQSVALGAPHNPLPHHPTNVMQDQKPRPASLSGNTLPATPLKEQAYAGPTFQASPAASSLPVPKFFSRSVPNARGQSALAQQMEAERTPEKESSPEPDIVAPNVPNRNAQQSPLDVFFKADRDEKQRSRSGLSPELVRRQGVQSSSGHARLPSNNDVFLPNAQGIGTEASSPHLTPPVSAPRPITAPHIASHYRSSANASDTESDREAKTKALKELIFSMDHPPALPQQTYTPRDPFNAYGPYQVYQTPSPSQRSVSGPSTPAPSNENQYFNPNYHYGNQRNLSPLFKAASGRQDTPPARPSGLRQHELPPTNGPPDPRFYQQPSAPVVDPNAFSRNFLQQHVNGPGPAAYPSPHNTVGAPPPPNPGPAQPGNAPMNGAANGAGPRDTKGMEDDLRRMLNINVGSH